MRIDEKIEKLMRHMNSLNDYDSSSDEPADRLKSFDQIYSMTNEHLYRMYKNMDVKNKDVLTVGSSGDQILYAILFGAKNITCFDINPFVKYFYDYKVAAIKAFDYDKFCDIARFNISKQEDTNWQRELLSAAVYKKVSCFLPDDSKYFWDNIFLDTNSVHAVFAEHPAYLPETYYKNKGIYQRLRNLLIKNNYSVRFVVGDITNIFDKIGIEKKYDVILLSNIFDYFDRNNQLRRTRPFYRLVKKYEQILKPNGKIQVDYIYSKGCFGYMILMNEFENMFGKDNISYITSELDDEATIIYKPNNKDPQNDKDLQK